jgi:predicted RNase H-like HicB family nuclease
MWYNTDAKMPGRECWSMRVVLKVVVYPKEDGPGYLAVCPTLQGCHAEGETIGAALDNLQDVATNMLDLLKEDGQPLPEPFVDAFNFTMDGHLAVSV